MQCGDPIKYTLSVSMYIRNHRSKRNTKLTRFEYDLWLAPMRNGAVDFVIFSLPYIRKKRSKHLGCPKFYLQCKMPIETF